MSLTRILAMARKEVIQILRDSRSLIIVVLMPATLMLLFGYGVNLDLKHLPVYVYDRDSSQQSQDLLKRFQSTDYFQIAAVVDNYPALTRALDDGSAIVGIVIPWDFSERLRGGGPVQVQVLLDASDDNTANVAMGYAQAIIQGYSSQVQFDFLRRRGQPAQAASVGIETRTWYNENLESRAFIIPGVLALVMSVIGAFLTSLTIAREWERGSMEQLISTPVSAMEIMLGKLGPYFLIGMVDVLICAFFAIYWFRVPFLGSYATLLITSSIFLVAVLAQGFLISVLAKNQFAACQIALLSTFLPAFLLSGFLFPIEQMPLVIRWLSAVFPARYYVSALKKIFLKGTSTAMLSSDLVPLVMFALILALLATRAFHKRLE